MKQLIYDIYNEDALGACSEELKAYANEHSHSALLFHLYCGINDPVWVTQIKERILFDFPEAYLVGISSHAEIIKGALTDPVVVLSAIFFESTSVSLHVFDDVLGKEQKVGEAARKVIDSAENIRACEILIQATPVDYRTIFHGIRQCDVDVAVFGAFPLSHDINGERHFLVGPDGIYDNALLMVTYQGDDFHINVGHTLGWESMGRTFEVTKSEGDILKTLDGKPAFDVYHKYLDIEADDDFLFNTMEFPLHMEDHGAVVLRQPSAVLEDGSLKMAGYVKQGMKVTMSYGDPNTIIGEVNVRAEEVRAFEPEVILLYTCAMRKFFWNYFINNEMEPFQKIACTGGFCSGGEIDRDPVTGRMLLHNVTMLTIAMREGDKKGLNLPKVKVDSSRLHGQASLVQRLSKLVRVTSDELRQTILDVEEANEKLRIMATVDELTALYNRREIERRINEALDNASSTEVGKVALIMIDVDHFKNVNDTCGHEVGDKILEGVAAVLNATVREYDGEAVGRWGGEEFFMLLPNTDLDEAVERAEEIRQTVELYPYPKIEHLTVSLGVTISDGSEDKKTVYKRVDDALYEAKDTGRNKTVVH